MVIGVPVVVLIGPKVIVAVSSVEMISIVPVILMVLVFLKEIPPSIQLSVVVLLTVVVGPDLLNLNNYRKLVCLIIYSDYYVKISP